MIGSPVSSPRDSWSPWRARYPPEPQAEHDHAREPNAHRHALHETGPRMEWRARINREESDRHEENEQRDAASENVSGDVAPGRIARHPAREQDASQRHSSEMADRTDHMPWSLGGLAVDPHPWKDSGEDGPDGAHDKKDNPELAETAGPDAACEPAVERQRQTTVDEEVELLDPPGRPGGERADRHGDPAVIGVQELLHEDEQDEEDRATDPGRGEDSHGRECTPLVSVS